MANTSLLSALCVTGKETEIAGQTFKIYELESQMVGLLLLEIEKASAQGVSVVKLLNPETGSEDQYFKNSWFKLGNAAQDVVFTLIAFSFGEFKRDKDGVPVPNLTQIRQISVNHLPAIIKAIIEVNQSFFDELLQSLKKAEGSLKNLIPGLSEAWSGQSNEEQIATDGLTSSPASDEAAG